VYRASPILENQLSKFKLIASLIGVVISALLAFGTEPTRPPLLSGLATANGALLSATFGSKTGITFQIEGYDKEFGYRSFGRLCGNVYEQLRTQHGKPVSIKYSPQPTFSVFGQPHSFQVFEIAAATHSICSYGQISRMMTSDGNGAGLGLLGFLLLIVCVASATTAAADLRLAKVIGKR
jgi:hypothetical protein